MNCLCNIFDDGNIWVWIIILLVLWAICSCGCGTGYSNYNNGGDRCCH